MARTAPRLPHDCLPIRVDKRLPVRIIEPLLGQFAFQLDVSLLIHLTGSKIEDLED